MKFLSARVVKLCTILLTIINVCFLVNQFMYSSDFVLSLFLGILFQVLVFVLHFLINIYFVWTNEQLKHIAEQQKRMEQQLAEYDKASERRWNQTLQEILDVKGHLDDKLKQVSDAAAAYSEKTANDGKAILKAVEQLSEGVKGLTQNVAVNAEDQKGLAQIVLNSIQETHQSSTTNFNHTKEQIGAISDQFNTELSRVRENVSQVNGAVDHVNTIAQEWHKQVNAILTQIIEEEKGFQHLLEKSMASIDGNFSGITEDVKKGNQIAEALNQEVKQLPTGVAQLMEEQKAKIEHTLNSTYGNIEALLSIYQLIELKAPLPELNEWTITAEYGENLLKTVLKHGSEHVVSIGGGVAAVLLAYGIRSNGKGKLTVIEHNRVAFTAMEDLIHEHQLEDICQLYCCEVTDYTIGEKTHSWYALDQVQLPKSIDLLAIHDAPNLTESLSTFPAVPLLNKYLSSHTVVLSNRKKRPKVLSIVIPVYKVENYLDHCLDSVFNGLSSLNRAKLEVIIVNDQSTDQSINIIKGYQSKFPEVVLVENSKNMGLGGARNEGVKQASGQYITFLDSDDWYEHGAVNALMDLCSGMSVNDVLVYGFSAMKDNQLSWNWLPKVSETLSSEEALYRFATDSITPAVWNKVYARALLEEVSFSENLYYEDLEFTPQVFNKAANVFLENSHLINYRLDGNSITRQATTEKHIEDLSVVLGNLYHKIQDDKIMSIIFFNRWTYLLKIWNLNETLMDVALSAMLAYVEEAQQMVLEVQERDLFVARMNELEAQFSDQDIKNKFQLILTKVAKNA